MATPFTVEPAPYSTALITKTGVMARNWVSWLTVALLPRLSATPLVTKPAVELLNQHDAIGVTDLLAGATAGIYRISWHLRITTVDGVSSSVTVRIHAVEGGAAITQSGAALNSDTLNAVQSGTVIATVDAGSLLSYSTLYASNTPNAAGYALAIVVERIT